MSTYSHLSVLKITASKRTGSSKGKNKKYVQALINATAFANSSNNTWYSNKAFPELADRNIGRSRFK